MTRINNHLQSDFRHIVILFGFSILCCVITSCSNGLSAQAAPYPPPELYLVTATTASREQPYPAPEDVSLVPTLQICDASWPTPPAIACPWLPTPTMQSTSIYPTATPWIPPSPPKKTPAPLPKTEVAKNPQGLLIYKGNVFKSKAIDKQGLWDQEWVALEFHHPVNISVNADYYASFSRLIPSSSNLIGIAIAKTEMGNVADIINLQTKESKWFSWTTPEGEAIRSQGVFFGWHPNGYEFLFREDYAPDRGLWLVNALTGEHRLIAQQPTLDISGAAISPDGQRLVYATNTFLVHQIWTANSDGSEPKLLLESDQIVYVYSWSPDSRFFLYAGEPLTNNTDDIGPLWVMDSAGKNRKSLKIPFIFGFGFQPVWSPSGYHVAAVGSTNALSECWQKGDLFKSDPLCRYRGVAVYVENLDTGKVGIVAKDSVDPMWSPDGELLAVSRMDEKEQVDIWFVDKTGANLQRVVDTPEIDRYPIWLVEESVK